MKGLLLAATALGLAGSIGTANAAPVGPPDTSITVDMWNLANTVPGGHNNSLDAVQQALPTARGAINAAGGTHFGAVPYAQPINYNLNPGGDVAATINQFFTSSGNPLPTGCVNDGTCGGRTGTAPGFASVTLYEFTFTTLTPEIFSVMHDDGASLFLAGTEGLCTMASNCTTDLLPFLASAPTSNANTAAINNPIAAGNYDLWYTSANGTPEILITDTVPVPAPLIGHGLLVLLAVGGVLFGGKFLESHKKHAA
jgi:hypothetical protein